jgi:phosphatidylglycerol---prolipoprotein diacylglyceryl transferase
MQQVLFHIPGTEGWFPPEGVPVHGYGVMLFITFIACVSFLSWQAPRIVANLPKERRTDLVIVVFIGGLIGARITFMIFDPDPHPLKDFFKIWEGGIILYGGIIAGIFAFLAFYFLVLKKAGVSLWKLGDVAGPCLALGIALGRIGCFLNGCCYGHVAPEGCPSAGFPLLTCPARNVVVDQEAYQTPTGFTVTSTPEDMRSVVEHVEPGSAAERAGLKPGDRIITVNGRKNVGIFRVVAEDPEIVRRVASVAEQQGAVDEPYPDGKGLRTRLLVSDLSKYPALRSRLNAEFFPFRVRIIDTDVFSDLIDFWPRGDQSLTLEVERAGKAETLESFTPRTLGLHPAQLYEVVSMVLLIFFLLSYYPFRAYDGQLFTLFLVVYAIHRFLNEMLRNDTEIVRFHMTLSQNISVLMLAFAACLEIGRRRSGNLFGPPPIARNAPVTSK